MSGDRNSSGMTTALLREALGLPVDNTPFPWQIELLSRFINGIIPPSIDIPTGLGKTGTMAIWLVARSLGAKLPRRLVYVVDRRAVVDQATTAAIELRHFVDRNPQVKYGLGCGNHSLPISTLRGRHIDNREWLEDPASSAIIVGTVDMIGSQLLFEGYGISRKMRPYHAGMLGADCLVVLDEAHLVPPFEKLLVSISEGLDLFGPGEEILKTIVPPFRMLPLSATSRSTTESFGLTEADFRHPEAISRLRATKRLRVTSSEPEKRLADVMAERAWELSGEGSQPIKIIVFCDKREDAVETKKAIEKRAGKVKNGKLGVTIDTELFVGGRRLFERDAATGWLVDHGFIARPKVKPNNPTFVVATSAAEVGVDLDADHMVCDLVPWERMVQRLGRVNRRGQGCADVALVVAMDPKEYASALKKEPERLTTKEKATVEHVHRLKAVLSLLDYLPHQDETIDVSLCALRDLRINAEHDQEKRSRLIAATTPAPLHPALSRALVEAWSMTSLKNHSGRAAIGPWLRGWIEEEDTQTNVIWRSHLPISALGNPLASQEVEAFFEAAPPHTSEILETETYRVVEWLLHRAKDLISGRPEETREAADLVAGTPELNLKPGDDSELHEGEHAIGNEDKYAYDNDDAALGKNDIIAFVLTPSGEVIGSLRIGELLDGPDKKANAGRHKSLHSLLARSTLVISACFGGLAPDGLLNQTVGDTPQTADDGSNWLSQPNSEPVIGFRVHEAEQGQPPVNDKDWAERLRLPFRLDSTGDPIRWLVIDKWRRHNATEDDRSAGYPQLLEDHHKRAEKRAIEIAATLGLPHEYAEILAVAARLHDKGKSATRWQRAFRAPADGTYAKTQGPLNVKLLDGYRHEFGSVRLCINEPDLDHLPVGMKDLALHLISSHHGFGRPIVETSGCDAPPSSLENLAIDVALRFARLQKRWGPWGLAWWEAVLRAADQQASRDNISGNELGVKEIA